MDGLVGRRWRRPWARQLHKMCTVAASAVVGARRSRSVQGDEDEAARSVSRSSVRSSGGAGVIDDEHGAEHCAASLPYALLVPIVAEEGEEYSIR